MAVSADAAAEEDPTADTGVAAVGGRFVVPGVAISRIFCILSLTLVVVDDVAKGQCSGASDVTIHSCGETR